MEAWALKIHNDRFDTELDELPLPFSVMVVFSLITHDDMHYYDSLTPSSL